MKEQAKITAFEKNGVRYERCKGCTLTAEKFISTIDLPNPLGGKNLRHSFNGIQQAIDNGYTPIYE